MTIDQIYVSYKKDGLGDRHAYLIDFNVSLKNS
jgi:hypothetical protein